jgi:hypothetical protein
VNPIAIARRSVRTVWDIMIDLSTIPSGKIGTVQSSSSAVHATWRIYDSGNGVGLHLIAYIYQRVRRELRVKEAYRHLDRVSKKPLTFFED